MSTKHTNQRWDEIASFGSAIAVCVYFMLMGGTLLVVVGAILRLLLFRTSDVLIEEVEMVFVGWPVLALLALFGYFVPLMASFHTSLLECIDAEPTPENPSAAREVQWCLEHLSWLHRTACRVRGRNYFALVNAVKDAKAWDTDRPLPDDDPSESPTIVEFLMKYPSEHFPMNLRDMRRCLRGDRDMSGDDQRRPSDSSK